MATGNYSRGMVNALANGRGIQALVNTAIMAPVQIERARQQAALNAAQTDKASQEAQKFSNLNGLFSEAAQNLQKEGITPAERNMNLVQRIGAYNTNAEQMADAIGKLQNTEWGRQIMAGDVDASKVNQVVKAITGKDLFNESRVPGGVINPSTGEFGRADENLVRGYEAIQGAKAEKERATAARQSRMGRGGGSGSGGSSSDWVVRNGADPNTGQPVQFRINKRTGEEHVIPYAPSFRPEKKSFADRMREEGQGGGRSSGGGLSLPVGTIEDGYEYLGGDPSKQSSWREAR